MQPPALKDSHLAKFHLETLLYIFYAMPRDVLQLYAAQELYARKWRYHRELKLWFVNLPDAATGVPQTVYFDLKAWERRLFTGNSQGLQAGFMGEEELTIQ